MEKKNPPGKTLNYLIEWNFLNDKAEIMKGSRQMTFALYSALRLPCIWKYQRTITNVNEDVPLYVQMHVLCFGNSHTSLQHNMGWKSFSPSCLIIVRKICCLPQKNFHCWWIPRSVWLIIIPQPTLMWFTPIHLL